MKYNSKIGFTKIDYLFISENYKLFMYKYYF